MDDRAPLRRIIGKNYHAAGLTEWPGGNVVLHLECGHEARRHISAEPKFRARCSVCRAQEEE